MVINIKYTHDLKKNKVKAERQKDVYYTLK